MESVSKQMSSEILYIVSFFSSRLKVCLFFFSTNTICVQLISTIIRNQFDTIYNLLQRTKSTTIARHFFFENTYLFSSAACFAFYFKGWACFKVQTKGKNVFKHVDKTPAKIDKRENAFINLPGEWS